MGAGLLNAVASRENDRVLAIFCPFFGGKVQREFFHSRLRQQLASRGDGRCENCAAPPGLHALAIYRRGGLVVVVSLGPEPCPPGPVIVPPGAVLVPASALRVPITSPVAGSRESFWLSQADKMSTAVSARRRICAFMVCCFDCGGSAAWKCFVTGPCFGCQRGGWPSFHRLFFRCMRFHAMCVVQALSPRPLLSYGSSRGHMLSASSCSMR
jgi:hypothetical protein